MDGDTALRRLIKGNARFVAGRLARPRQRDQWRRRLAAAQKPFAVVLGCSDSRVPPELVFDQGFGDLFVVRVAGHVVTPDVLGSIQYAVRLLKESPVAERPLRARRFTIVGALYELETGRARFLAD